MPTVLATSQTPATTPRPRPARPVGHHRSQPTRPATGAGEHGHPQERLPATQSRASHRPRTPDTTRRSRAARSTRPVHPRPRRRSGPRPRRCRTAEPATVRPTRQRHPRARTPLRLAKRNHPRHPHRHAGPPRRPGHHRPTDPGQPDPATARLPAARATRPGRPRRTRHARRRPHRNHRRLVHAPPRRTAHHDGRRTANLVRRPAPRQPHTPTKPTPHPGNHQSASPLGAAHPARLGRRGPRQPPRNHPAGHPRRPARRRHTPRHTRSRAAIDLHHPQGTQSDLREPDGTNVRGQLHPTHPHAARSRHAARRTELARPGRSSPGRPRHLPRTATRRTARPDAHRRPRRAAAPVQPRRAHRQPSQTAPRRLPHPPQPTLAPHRQRPLLHPRRQRPHHRRRPVLLGQPPTRHARPSSAPTPNRRRNPSHRRRPAPHLRLLRRLHHHRRALRHHTEPPRADRHPKHNQFRNPRTELGSRDTAQPRVRRRSIVSYREPTRFGEDTLGFGDPADA